MKLISICIPTYEMKGLGIEFLRQSFDVMTMQTLKDFDVVISDHSVDDRVMTLCRDYSGKLDIHYLRNKENIGSSAANINNAMRNASGKLIKILFQDDYLYHDRSLEDIANSFNLDSDSWLVTACIHTRDGKTYFREFHPVFHPKIHFRRNTISSPSVLTIKNDSPLMFDENLLWYMDTDYYRRMYLAHGVPKILDSVNVVNRAGEHQVTHATVTSKIRRDEFRYMLKKHAGKFESIRLRLAYDFRELKQNIKTILRKNR